MSKPTFRFQRFAINDDRCGMKIGTDGVLVGAWADVQGVTRILDIGTGCGLIALMLAQRTEASGASVVAIELDDLAASQATENVAISPWPDRIHVQQASIQEFAAKHQEDKFDLCVCNPPFFTDCSRSRDKGKRLARHADTLSREALFESVNAVLQQAGRFCLVLPAQQLASCCEQARKHGFALARQTSVRPFPHAEVKRVLLDFVGGASSVTRNETKVSELAIESSRHKFSSAYESLTSKFHLRFDKTITRVGK